jgi:predicted DNA-binding transcriptional regulator AlpA
MVSVIGALMRTMKTKKSDELRAPEAPQTEKQLPVNLGGTALSNAGSGMESDWLRIRDVVHTFKVSRSFVYELIKAGTVKSVSLRKRHNIKGIRLVSRSSFEEFIDRAWQREREPLSRNDGTSVLSQADLAEISPIPTPRTNDSVDH